MRRPSFRQLFFKNFGYILVAGVLLFFLIVSFGSTFFEILKLDQQKRDLQKQISERQEVNNQLNEDIAQIGSQSYIERIARNYLNLYYPYEQIVIPVESTTPSLTGTPTVETPSNPVVYPTEPVPVEEVIETVPEEIIEPVEEPLEEPTITDEYIYEETSYE